jgi:uncharacterized glyoxalase superfamily protein PhnB
MASFTRTIPLLVCEDIEAAHEFLVEVFGLQPGAVDRDGDGKAVHGEVRLGNDIVWLHRVAPEYELGSPRTMPRVSGGIVVHVDDVDAHFAHARACGARIESEPSDQEYGQREYGARDLDGHHWWFATPVPGGRVDYGTR